MSKLAKALTAAAGNAAGESLYVEDVFSIDLDSGASSGTVMTIAPNLDLSEGGLLWRKSRGGNYNNRIFDSETSSFDSSGYYGRNHLVTNSTSAKTDFQVSNSAQFTSAGWVHTSENSDGFTNTNTSYGAPYVNWTFRKAEKFFDVVTWTGNGDGTDRYYNHNLGSVPNCIIVKRTDAAMNWAVYHLQLGTGADSNLELNTTDAIGGDNINPIRTTPSSTRFHVRGSSGEYNENNATYVAYLFASDAGGFGDDGSESIIKCGSYTGNGSVDGTEVDCGFEPQFLLLKAASTVGNWLIYDNMRGFVTGGTDAYLRPNLSSAEGLFESGEFLPNGFKLKTTDSVLNGSGSTYIYIAIRRPMKTPESGTEVFKTIEQNWSTGILDAGFPVDLAIFQQTDAGNNGRAVDRLRGNTQVLNPNDTFAEGGEPYYALDNNEGFELVSSPLSNNWVWWMFKRATGFFDVVAYTGDGAATQTLNHNLGVTPDIIVVKKRSTSGSQWPIIITSTTDTMYLNTTNASFGAFYYIDNPTSTTFDVQTDGSAPQSNQSGETYIAYLFATLAGVSKVGSYTGTGSNVDVDCGFSAGARFILIKRTDSTGDWYVYDSVRGIVAGNDPYLLLNSTAAEVTSTDYIDPLASGFTVTSSAPAALNASGGTYIFLAIA